jgi:hypothetical protein
MAFRLAPAMPVGAYKTYAISQPKTAHTRLGSCEAAGCEANLYGWKTTVPMLSAQAAYIRNSSGRRFREVVVDGQCVFTFYPGQQCFTQHYVQDRPQIFRVRGGDWRGNPTGQSLTHRNGQDWVDDFGEHQAKLAEQIEKG